MSRDGQTAPMEQSTRLSHLTQLSHASRFESMLATQTMSTAQAAHYLGVSKRTVTRLAATGELPYLVKLPGRTGSYVFDAATVAEFKAARGL